VWRHQEHVGGRRQEAVPGPPCGSGPRGPREGRPLAVSLVVVIVVVVCLSMIMVQFGRQPFNKG